MMRGVEREAERTRRVWHSRDMANAKPRPSAGRDETRVEGILTPADEWADVPPKVRALFVAAVETFADRGYHATTTRDIATQADLSPAGLYVHFSSKEQMLYEICRFGHGRVLELMQAAAKVKDPVIRVAAIARDLTIFHAEHHTLARVNQNEFRALSPELRKQIVGMRWEIVDIQRKSIVAGKRKRAFVVEDVIGTSAAILTMCLDVARWFPTREIDDPDQLGDLYAQLVLRMVGVPGT